MPDSHIIDDEIDETSFSQVWEGRLPLREAISRIYPDLHRALTGEVAVDPSLTYVNKAIIGDINLYAGGGTMVDREYDQRIDRSRRDALATPWRWLRELQRGNDYRLVFSKVAAWDDKWLPVSEEQIDWLHLRHFDYDNSQSDEGERAVWLAIECRPQRGHRATNDKVDKEVARFVSECQKYRTQPTAVRAHAAILKALPNATRGQVRDALKQLIPATKGRPKSVQE
jgi:hypothetical protein